LAEERLTGSDKRTLLLWIIFGIVGALFAQRYFFQAFPEASVDFKISRPEAQKRAKDFVEGLGENVSGHQSTIVFDVDENGKTYLERELGLRKANELMSSELHIWFWEVRFFRPEQKEEYKVRVSPAGQVVAYEHTIDETKPAKSLERDEALSAAEKFLVDKLGTDLSRWDFLPEEANSMARPNRVDWSFTWERKGFRAKEAPYRLEVGLQGDRIGSTQEFLQVPEAWTRDYQRLRSTNIFYNQIAVIPYGFLIGGALWLGISLTRQGKTTWGWPIKIGLLVAVLFALMQMNQWDTFRAEYDTHASYASFVTLTLAKILLDALGTGLMVTIALPAGEPLYREAQPERLRLYKAFTARGVQSKEFFCSALVGLSLAAAHIGFIVAFYMVGSKFGVWAPQDLNYSDAVNTSFPWIAGVAIGVMAATSEEFTFRLFAIPFLRKFTGSRVLAVILPAFFWSFLHSAYPQEPGYIRGIEVGLIGIVAGLVMLRWGILATLTWHYTVDASLVGLLLIRSDNLYFKISGIVVGLAALAPLTFAGISYLRRGHFEDVQDLLNGAEPVGGIELARHTEMEEVQVASRRYDALKTGTIGFLALCLVIGGLLAWRMKTEHIGDYLRVASDGRATAARADVVMREHGFDPGRYRKAAQLVDTTNPIANEFLRRRMAVSQINEIYKDQVPGALWRVRYFRDSEPEEFAIILRPDGALHAYRHTLPEAAKGASLSKDDANMLAKTYLGTDKEIDLSQWKLVESNSDKRPNRTDHTLTWQKIAPLDPVKPGEEKDSTDHAYARMDLQILGDEPANYRTYIKIPEDFVRTQEEQSLPRTLLQIATGLLALGLFIAVLVFYFKSFRATPAVAVPWRRMVRWGLVGLAAAAVNFLLGRGIPGILANYKTEVSLHTFFGITGVGLLLVGTLLFGVFVLLFGLAWHFAARAFGEEQLPTWLGMPAEYYRDAFWIAVGGSAALIGMRRLLDVISAKLPVLHRGVPSSFGGSFDGVYPAAAVIGGTIVLAVLVTGVLALAGGFVGAEIRVRWLRMALFFGVAIGLISNWGNGVDFVWQMVANLVLLGFVVFGIRHVARFNVLGWFLMVACTGLLAGGVELLRQPATYYRVNGYFVMAGLIALLAWPLVSWRLGNSATQAKT
jgi:membrane protease YdiL (CAAX protease family)